MCQAKKTIFKSNYNASLGAFEFMTFYKHADVLPINIRRPLVKFREDEERIARCSISAVSPEGSGVSAGALESGDLHNTDSPLVCVSFYFSLF